MENKGITIWLTGLSGSGKTTIADRLHLIYTHNSLKAVQLDGDEVRNGLNTDLEFSLSDRTENIRRVAEICKLINKSGVDVIASFISPTHTIRKIAKQIIGEENFKEIFIKTSIEECKRRDPKCLYKQAESGHTKEFTGIDSIYEEPIHPFLVIENISPDEAAALIFEKTATRVNA